MTALIVTGSIIAFIALLMLLRVHVTAEYWEKGFYLSAGYGPVNVRILPAREKKTGKKEKKTIEKKVEKKEKQPAEKKGGGLKSLLDILGIARDALGRLKRKLVINELLVHITVGSGNAASAALMFGGISAAEGLLMPLIDNTFRLKKRDVASRVDFTAGETTVWLRAKLSLALGSVVWIGLRALIKFIKIKTAADSAAAENKQPDKDPAKNKNNVPND